MILLKYNGQTPNPNELKLFANYIIGGRPHITSLNLQRIDNDVLCDRCLFATWLQPLQREYVQLIYPWCIG